MRYFRNLILSFALLGSGALPGEEYSADFIRALRLLQSDRPESRKDGEQIIRKLGAKAVPQLKLALAQAERYKERLRQLLAELEGRPGPQEDLTGGEVLQRYFTSQLENGWDLLLKGNYATARRIAEALEALDKDSPLFFDYRRLKRECDKHSLVKEVLEPSVEWQKRVYEAGESPSVLFRLTNHEKTQLVIQAQKGFLGELEVSQTRSYFEGKVVREVQKFPIRTFNDAEQVVLPGGQSYERIFPLPLGQDVPEKRVVVQLRAIGRFRPSQWGVGDRNVSESLDVPASECWIVPPGEENLAQSPLRKLEVALFFKDIDTFFIAGQLAVWAGKDDPILNERLAKLLVQNLNLLDDFGFEIANRFLLEVSGLSKPKNPDRIFWREWWGKHRGALPDEGE
ncbi:MAG: hypothetical protein HY717_05675 [Planctomycetes bacterium]|nr:hypothetical protein [Planctomycetota bacterium]